MDLILEAMSKEAQTPYYQRAMTAQLHRPSWDSRSPFLQNILRNVQETSQRGQKLVNQQEATLDWQTSLDPSLGFARIRSTLQGQDPIAPNAIDRLLFIRTWS